MTTAPPAAHSPINANIGWSGSSGTLFGLSQNVKYRSIFNDTDKKAYVYFSASAASTSAFTTIVAAGALFVFPEPVYNNQCTIIGEAGGTGSWRTTQY